jgi:hypothetical protein
MAFVLTGKKGPWSVGTLFADDQSPGESVGPNDPLFGRQAYFGIVRVSREFGKNGSNIGVLYTDRELRYRAEQPFVRMTHASRGLIVVGGVDGHIQFNKIWQLNGQAVFSQTVWNDGTHENGAGIHLYLERSTRNLEMNSLYKDNGPGFQTRTGFFQRPDIRWFSNFCAAAVLCGRQASSVFTDQVCTPAIIWDHSGPAHRILCQCKLPLGLQRTHDLGYLWQLRP